MYVTNQFFGYDSQKEWLPITNWKEPDSRKISNCNETIIFERGSNCTSSKPEYGKFTFHTNNRNKATMSEVQVNSVLSSQSVDSVDSIKNANGEPIMSKSKARSLRRKRAKQRKQALESQQMEKVEELQDKENQAAPAPQESQVAKKKKRKRKKKTNGAVTSNGAVSTSKPGNLSETESAISAKTETTEEAVDEPAKAEAVEEPVATTVETKAVEASIPASIYEDDNEGKGRTDDNCDCACIIS